MAISRAQWNWHIAQVIPRRLVHHNGAHHPAGVAGAKRRNDNVQLRLADRMTAFPGSMDFSGFTPLFSPLMFFLDKSPWPTLALVVPLAAIFLTTFVMVGWHKEA